MKKIPLGSVNLPDGWVESTLTTLRLPHKDPARSMSIVLKRVGDRTRDPAEVLAEETKTVKRTLGAAMNVAQPREVRFLGAVRPCFVYSFEMGGERVKQALVAGVGPGGAFTATATAVSKSFEAHWPELTSVIESFATEDR